MSIYDADSLEKYLMAFSRHLFFARGSIIDVRMGSKYFSCEDSKYDVNFKSTQFLYLYKDILLPKEVTTLAQVLIWIYRFLLCRGCERVKILKVNATRLGEWWWRIFQKSVNSLKKSHNLLCLGKVLSNLIK